MPAKSMEERILTARAAEREKYGAAMAVDNGPLPFGKTLSEAEQDDMWMETDPKYADPQAFAMLTMPKEQGGAGLTPLAASLVKYPKRKLLYEGAGASITDHIAYANDRQKRVAKRGLLTPPEPPIAPQPAPVAAQMPPVAPPPVPQQTAPPPMAAEGAY